MDAINITAVEPRQPETVRDPDATTTAKPARITTLNLYRRLPFGRQHFFGHDNPDQAADYFIINPTPQKNSSTWRPIFYRGDNPKYASASSSSSTKPIGRALRTPMGNSFQIQLGDGVSEVLENKTRVKKRKCHERKQKARRLFRMAEKPPKESLEDVEEVKGLVVVFKMHRQTFLGRRLEWKLGGRHYEWKGTRRFVKHRWPFGKLKGISHDLKLVDKEQNAVIATFEKDRWASFKRSEKIGHPPNKKRQFIGTLRFFNLAAAAAPGGGSLGQETLERIRPSSSLSPHQDSASFNCKFSKKLVKDVNLGGSHSGDILEDAIAFTCWIAVEAEHRLRYKIFDLIEAAGESFGG